MIDRATVERIKAAADIVEVVSDYVHLTRRGANFMGLCPFHNERTPSFSVNRRKNFCYCFSCHKGGSPVNFIMEKEGISYHDALLQLADKYGIKVEERELSDEERAAQSQREAMLVVNEWAMRLFEKNLHESEEGRNIGLEYFYQRGVTDESIKEFHLGYSLDKSTALIDEARKAGYDLNVLKSVGLIGESREGRLYDRFRGRVIYPIMNSAGKTIAFGGRDLKGGPAKYINSPESELYKKSNELYGIYQAKNSIGRDETCFLVEGYMDVIGMWQSGLQNTIASSGTALTNGQIALIHRFAKNVVLIYDGDNAGIKAALRGIDMLLSHSLNLKILLLPDGDDPDSFARKHTPEEFRDYVNKNAVDVIRFKTEVLMKDASNDPIKRSEAIHSIVQSIANIPDKIKRVTYIQQCADALNVPEKIILAEAEKARIKVLDNWKKEKEKENLEREFESQDKRYSEKITPSLSTNEMSEQRSSVVIPQRTQASEKSDSNAPFEREIIRYCIKYGMAVIFRSADENGNERDLTVMDYLYDELEYDNIRFTVPEYANIFEKICQMQNQYFQDLKKCIDESSKVIENMRREGYDEIASKNLSTTKIEVEESHLEERLTLKYHELIDDFIIDYPGRHLASHEDDKVRRTATELLTEKVILSKRFRMMGCNGTEYQRISDLVPRALAEWKDGILHNRLIDINEQMRQAVETGDTNLISELQSKAFSIMQSRREAAKFIGDRIISTKR
ncbi:MAG: DNA primase [Prevotella sp.]|nr:DNA primase [Bacteroides sp.]MCM1365612.1 DNA primase [Prevotella sp.]